MYCKQKPYLKLHKNFRVSGANCVLCFGAVNPRRFQNGANFRHESRTLNSPNCLGRRILFLTQRCGRKIRWNCLRNHQHRSSVCRISQSNDHWISDSERNHKIYRFKFSLLIISFGFRAPRRNGMLSCMSPAASPLLDVWFISASELQSWINGPARIFVLKSWSRFNKI